ncbi:MAG: DUF488 domain-containing protein [Candidatus Promineofilum sp.]|nr:DUF488 domain-containing protein [Promineifilum sp.]MCW5862506.1 DUF488 domain-containing protein [Anaerolineae bacterium]
MNKVYTIGVIGYDADGFFRALQEAGVDTLIDIRRRRAVRGRDYAFANSQRLQARLAELGIGYLHRLDLAPTTSVRTTQRAADEAAHVATRQRAALSPAFAAAYEREVLSSFDPQALADALPAGATVALLCVEREPAACHRSLVAARLAEALGVAVAHLTPD